MNQRFFQWIQLSPDTLATPINMGSWKLEYISFGREEKNSFFLFWKNILKGTSLRNQRVFYSYWYTNQWRKLIIDLHSYGHAIKNYLFLFFFLKTIFLRVFFLEIWIFFWHEWLHHSTQEAESCSLSVLLRDLKMGFFYFLKNAILKVFYLRNYFFWQWRPVHSHPCLLFSPQLSLEYTLALRYLGDRWANKAIIL